MFVVCGEALMDVFATGQTKEGVSLDARVGGSPFNVAIGLARLAQKSSFLGGVSTGFLGDRLMLSLNEEGVNTATVVRLDAPTTLGLVGLDARGVPSYGFYGDGCADRLLQPEHLAAIPADTSVFQFGSYATVVEPIASTLRTLIERVGGRTLITYDPNVRLNVEPRIDVWRRHIDWMLPRTHLLKVSDEDLQLLFPGQAIESLATAWLAAGVRLMVVTRGSEGAVAWSAAGRIITPPVKVTVVDTVGAGDTFQAALLTWLSEQGLATPAGLSAIGTGEMARATAFAAAAAAITCSRRGADLPRRVELPAG
jgi:fructokinase